MDPSVADFVPSRGRQLSLTALPAGFAEQPFQPYQAPAGPVFQDLSRSTSANPPHHEQAFSKSASHNRSHSLPGGPGSRGRGGPLRGRGSLRGRGRGAHQVHQARESVAKKPPTPALALDSAADFPALGGAPAAKGTCTSHEVEDTAAREPSQIEKTSPTLPKSISFARIVAPTPPPEASVNPSSGNTNSQNNGQGLRSVSDSSKSSSKAASVADPSSSGSEHAGSSPPSSNSPEPQEQQAAPATEVPNEKKGKRRGPKPGFEQPQLPLFYQEPQGLQYTGLTPVQQAFIAANGLSVEGLPNVSNSSIPVEQLPGYYNPPPVHPNANGSSKTGLSKKEQKRLNKALQQQPDSMEAYWQYGYPQPPQGYPENGYEGFYGAPAMPDPSFMGASFGHHLSPNAPTFEPGQLHADAPAFQPSHIPSSQPELVTPTEHHDDAQLGAPDANGTEGLSEKSPEASAEVGLSGEDAVTSELEAANGSIEDTPKPTVETLPVVLNGSAEDDDQEQQGGDEQEPGLVEEVPAAVSAEPVGPSTSPEQDQRSEPSQGQQEEAEAEVPAGGLTSTSDSEEHAPTAVNPAPVGWGPAPDQYGESGAFREPVVPETVQSESAPAEVETSVNETSQARQEASSSETTEVPKSPPHSSFSLLPPVTVDDVLGKATDFVESVTDSVGNAVEEVKKAVVPETVSEGTEATEDDGEDIPAVDEPSVDEVRNNLDENDLPTVPDAAQVEEPEDSMEVAEPLDDQAVPETRDEELPKPLHSQDPSGSQQSDQLNASEVSQHSVSPSEVERALLSPEGLDEYAEALDAEIARAAEAEQPQTPVAGPSTTSLPVLDIEVVPPTAKPVLSDGDSEERRPQRSSAPSPPSRPERLPSTRTSPVLTQPPLLSPSISTRASAKPPLRRGPSEAEKAAAIRLIAQLRNNEDSDYSEPASALEQPGDAESHSRDAASRSPFKFDLSDKLQELNSSKRKRDKRDIEGRGSAAGGEDNSDDEDEDKKQNSGEAPSLTLSIFSGSILPRKQLILSVLASFGINLFLPFVNGVMLGFGEIFARDWLGPFFGFTTGSRANGGSSQNTTSTFNRANIGLRGAGQRGGAQDLPGHAAAKTAVEAVSEGAIGGATS